MMKKSPSDLSLLQYLIGRYKDVYSGKQLKKAVDRGFCLLNGKVEKYSSVKLKEGDEVLFREEGVVSLLQKETLETIFEDESLFIFNKPSGMKVEELSKKGLLVHRLDRPTSGLVIVAKTKQMQEALEDLFRQRKITKGYVAWVKGIVRETRGKIEEPIGCASQFSGQKMMRVGKGKEAATSWKVLKRKDKETLVQLTPLTGRTHQLRVHMASIGHPVIGDHQYGFNEASRLLLHAERLEFLHPKTNKKMFFQAKRPFA